MSQIMMPAYENRPVQYQQPPVLENSLSPDEMMNELICLLQSQPNSTSSSDTTTSNRRCFPTLDPQQRQKRKLSNRESAKRSRLRKKRHLENLENELKRLKVQNSEIKNRLCTLTRDCLLVQSDSNRLLSESIYLQQKFTGLNRMLSPTMQLH